MEYILLESQLGYTSDFFKLITDAPIENIKKLNVLEHRASWVKIKDIASSLTKDGFMVIVTPITPTKHYLEYLKDPNFILLKYGNY